MSMTLSQMKEKTGISVTGIVMNTGCYIREKDGKRFYSVDLLLRDSKGPLNVKIDDALVSSDPMRPLPAIKEDELITLKARHTEFNRSVTLVAFEIVAK